MDLLLEISNPHDATTFRAETPADAAAAMFVLGEGEYGATAAETGDLVVPIFILGGATEWFERTHGVPFRAYLDANLRAVARTLRTVIYGEPAVRATVEAAVAALPEADRAAFIAAHNDRLRTSLSDMATRAARLADRMDEIATKRESAAREP